MLTLLEILNRTTEFFASKGIPNAKLDAELLLAHVLKCQRLQLYLQFERVLEEITLEKLRPLVKRRGMREPLQYIIGEVDWAGLKLTVDKRVLIPRHETEELWERITDEYKNRMPARIVDLGTGSGALALALKKKFPSAKVEAVDASHDALTLALGNAQRLNLEIDFIEGQWCQRLTGPYDLIVSNPPYLTDDEYNSAQPEVREWEPKEALVAPDQGFDDIATIMTQAKPLLAPGGELWLETGIAHTEPIRRNAESLGYTKTYIYKDYQGRPRFARLIP